MTLFATMTNLRMELFKKFGKEQIFLKEIMNSDTTLAICSGKYGSVFGEVEFQNGEWTLSYFDYENFEHFITENATLSN